MHRRDFLHTAALGASLLLPAGRHAWAATADQPTRQKLIVVMLRGAVDGMNVVAPVADPLYRQLRPTIGLAESEALKLDGYFGLHPALAPLLPLWEQNKLAFVHASGSPDPTRSHFDAQDYLESATPGRKSTQDGWLNRLLGALPGPATPTRALAVGPTMPRILSGPVGAMNVASAASAGRADVLDRPEMGAAFHTLYADHPRFGKAFKDGRLAHKEVMDAALNKEMMAADRGAPLPYGFPDDAAQLARMMRNEPKIQVAFIPLGGWDTHVNQGGANGQLANRLAPLGLGLATLAQRLGPLFDDTTIVVMSEFGRTAKENGNGGTDHGHGNAMWLLGGRVAGGKVYGEWKGLDAAGLNENRDLPVTTDFRWVLAQVAERHLGLPDRQLSRLFPSMPRPGIDFRVMSA
jgi:uncharacterized protein (DUF1501 family)